MATEIADAVKINIRPATENHAAIAAIVIAVINVIIGNNIIIPPYNVIKSLNKEAFFLSYCIYEIL
jgi:hypothetical protein